MTYRNTQRYNMVSAWYMVSKKPLYFYASIRQCPAQYPLNHLTKIKQPLSCGTEQRDNCDLELSIVHGFHLILSSSGPEPEPNPLPAARTLTDMIRLFLAGTLMSIIITGAHAKFSFNSIISDHRVGLHKYTIYKILSFFGLQTSQSQTVLNPDDFLL